MLDEEIHVWLGKLDRTAAHAALRRVLALYLDEDPAAIELCRGAHGKPRLAAPGAALRFNLSHSADRTLIALAHGREVGVDVEAIRPRRRLLRLAERGLDPAAAAAVRAAAPGERLGAFHAAWVRHEAIAKCHGVGLHRPLPSRPVVVRPLDAGPGFAAALAVSGEEMPATRLFPLAVEPRHRSELRRHAAAPR